MRYTFFSFLVLFIFYYQGHSGPNIQFEEGDYKWANEKLSQMSTRDKIAQLFMVNVSPKPSNIAEKKRALELIRENKIGGVIIMKGDYGLTSEWNREFQKKSKIPLLIAIDGEWGIRMRIGNTTKFPYALTLGALSDDSLIYEMGRAIARDCRRLGIHVNFAPVADVNVNPNNPVINYRSFGENKMRVSEKCSWFSNGMQSELVMACAKHFPGHGDTDVDSHHDLPVIKKSRETLDNLEFYPFRELINNEIWSIMVAHLKVPSLDPRNTTSLSRTVITDILKNEMEFEGLVFSDALNMKGATKSSGPGALELEAYKAGNDFLLMSQNISTAIQKIETYVTKSQDTNIMKDLNERVRKILLFKHKLKTQTVNSFVASPDETNNKKLVKEIYKKALTFISTDNTSSDDIIDKSKKTLVISLSNKSTSFSTAMHSFSNFSFSRESKTSSYKDYDNLLNGAKDYEQIVVAYHDLSKHSSKNYGLSSQQIKFISDINKLDNVINVWFGNPYGLKYFQNAKNIIIGYEDNEYSQIAVHDKLFYNETFEGILPVSAGKFKEGDGYKKVEPSQESGWEKATTYVKDVYNEQNDKTVIVSRVYDICHEMVSNGVAPGGQIYVLHKGEEVFSKSFGRHAYSTSSKQVLESDMYDLASLTKILGTTIATMKLREMGRLRLSDKVSDHLILDDSTNISDITIAELLTHEAGLTPYIPFYIRFNDTNFFRYFRTSPTANFTTKVAEDLYVIDSYKDDMWNEMIHAKRRNIGQYKYSDLSMYIMQRIVESAAGMPMDQFLYTNFYQPMGIDLCYNPAKKYDLDDIVPTEFDTKFRLQLVNGYVHDQGCALYGGVCGHAGLFGNAKDVAQIMLMLIQGGTYKGKQYLKPESVSLFTAQHSPVSRRGLGFDKPNVDDRSASPTSADCSFATFGHTGFTGTCAWADPFNDLIYVFLSNRIYPDMNNKKLARGDYRERLHSLFYLYTKEPETYHDK